MLPPVPVMTHTFPESLPDISPSLANTWPGYGYVTSAGAAIDDELQLSRQVGAAVDKNRLTVYVGAVVREQERHHGRDVLWGAEAR